MAFMGILLVNVILMMLLGAVVFDFVCLIVFIIFLILSIKDKKTKWKRIVRNVLGIVFLVCTLLLLGFFLFLKYGA